MRSLRAGRTEYSLKAYGAMIADSVRMNAYREALAQAVKPGSVVVDIGAGTGIMSLLACKLGAERVHAVEPSDAVAVGIELARANGCSHQIEFHQGSSFDLDLGRRADVVVSDLRGVLPLHGLHIPSIVDARTRLLKVGGVQIPRSDTIRAQLVTDEALHAENFEGWSNRALGLNLSPALRWAAHQWRKADFSRSRLVAEPRSLIELDYRTVESANARGETTWQLNQAETVHGIAAWFDTVLIDGVGFSNAPDRPRSIYGQLFFPFSEPVSVRPREHVGVTLAATLVGHEYVWQWDVSVKADEGRLLNTLRHSSFQAAPVNPSRLAPRSSDYVPDLSAEGRAAVRALQLMRDGRTVDDIARKLEEEFPELDSARPGRARELVGDLSEWFAR